jgi:hypothetical protein
MTSPNRPTAAESTATAAERYAVLAVRNGISLGALRSGSFRDFALVLGAAAQGFPHGRIFTEREVNDVLRTFLAEAGSMLATDHVELRRWLIDFSLLERDGFGRAYTAGAPATEFAAAAAELSKVDLALLAREARAREAAARAQRKERWEQGR